MSYLVVVCAVLSAISALLLLIFALFVIGFLIGYRHEEKRISNKNCNKDEKEAFESDEEKKAKEEWKKFLKYDGSAPDNR